MKYFVATSLILICNIFVLSAQHFEWGNIDAADLAMTVYAPDTNAAAVVLLDQGEIRLDFSNRSNRSVLKRLIRIKILDKAGLSEGDISIPHHEEHHYLHDLRLHTVAPDGRRHSVRKDDIFVEEHEEGWRLTKLSAPRLSVGSIIEYQYTLDTKYLSTLPTWYFQKDIPTRRSELEVYLPSWVNYVFLINKPNLLAQNEFEDQFGENISRKTAVRHRRSFAAENLPAIKAESYVANIDDHRLNVQFQLAEYAPPSGGYFKFLEDWERTARDLLEHPNLGRQISHRRYSKKVTAQAEMLTGNVSTELEKVQQIYRFLQQKMKWNGDYRAFTDSNLDHCLTTGTGNSGEINLMALVMLQRAGLDAHPVVVSTRSHGKHILAYPIVSQFNHLLVLVKIDGNDILLDATSSYRPLGFTASEALNKNGFLLKWDDYQWIDISPNKSKDIIAANLELTPDGQVRGEVKTRCMGYSAINERELLADSPAGNFWVDRFNKQFAEVEIGDMQFQHVADLDIPLSNNFKVQIGDAAQVANDFIYLNPTLYSNFLENPFKQEQREYPVEMPYPFQQQTILNIQLPPGYAIADLPAATNRVLPAGGGQFTYSITEKSGSIQVATKIVLNQLIYEPHEYADLKTFFDLIIEKQGEQIVLKKGSVAND